VKFQLPAIVKEFSGYATVADAIGFCFQINDHAFYVLTFPTASRTWVWDLKSKQWLEWLDIDVNGTESRHRFNCCAFAFNKVVGGDYANGSLYYLDPTIFTNDDNPVTRIRTFPHMQNSGNTRINYLSFDADIECGTSEETEEENAPPIWLSWSDDRGKTFGNPLMQSMGLQGEYSTVPSWNRLGQARDRVFKLQWSAPIKTALNGAFIETKAAKT
jgi:hypothetical protein